MPRDLQLWRSTASERDCLSNGGVLLPFRSFGSAMGQGKGITQVQWQDWGEECVVSVMVCGCAVCGCGLVVVWVGERPDLRCALFVR